LVGGHRDESAQPPTGDIGYEPKLTRLVESRFEGGARAPDEATEE
jgi:hypothetical protein